MAHSRQPTSSVQPRPRDWEVEDIGNVIMSIEGIMSDNRGRPAQWREIMSTMEGYHHMQGRRLKKYSFYLDTEHCPVYYSIPHGHHDIPPNSSWYLFGALNTFSVHAVFLQSTHNVALVD